MPDLFTSPNELRRFTMPRADVRYAEHADLGGNPDDLFQEILATLEWQRPSIIIQGRQVQQPLLISWHGDPTATYTYSQMRLMPKPWTPALQTIREAVERASNAQFNAVLVNLYQDQRSSLGMHSDNEPEMGSRPTIASVSLGAVRRFVFQPKRWVQADPVSIDLAHGSLLVMAGETQSNWRHGIPKASQATGARINLTFRKILHPS